MAIFLEERKRSRGLQVALDGSGASQQFNFLVLGTDDDALTRSLLESALPSTYAGGFLQSWRMDYQGGGLWYVEARYTTTPPLASSRSFSTSGGTQHITQSRETIRQYTFTEHDPPDYQGAIGVGTDTVEGCDIHVPVFNFTETHKIAVGLVTPSYERILMELTATTNIEPFKGYEIGEVLFMGADGSLRGVEYYEITYKFSVLKNRDDIRIATIPDLLEKRGWEYLWIRYADRVDDGARALVRRPVAAYVERVYEEGDHSLLGIGV